MQSTRSASMIAFRISPSPDWFADIEPFARTKPEIPPGARWWIMCWTQVKLAFPTGGTPYFHRTSSRRRSPAPVAHVEGRVRQDEVRSEIGVQVLVKGVSVVRAEVRFDPADRQVHLGEPPGRRVRLLAEDRDVADPAAVLAYELLALHEHPARAAAGVVHAPLVGFNHLDEQPDNAPGRVELAALLALRAGELAKEVLVDAPEDVLGPAVLVSQPNGRDQVDQLTESLFVECRAGVVLRENAFERRVLLLDGDHGVVDDLADGGLLG